MSDLLPGLSYREFVAAAERHRSERSFRNTDFFHKWGASLEALLTTPVHYTGSNVSGGNDERPRAAGRSLRVLHWNIEKGKKLGGIIRFLTEDQEARQADIICLNEVDWGMARTANRDVTADLAEPLGMNAVYMPNYLECTKGLPRERNVPGENERGLHGTAILTKLPMDQVGVEVLPHCWDYFDYREKRFGGRRGLYVKLLWNGRPLIVATTHREMRGEPPCRARQFDRFLAGLARIERQWGEGLPAILTGDWNTHTFRRGGLLDTCREFVRIVGTRPAARLDRELLEPFMMEPLFDRLSAAGFRVEGLNDTSPTAFQALDNIEDLAHLPPQLGEALLRVSGLKGRTLGLRLDWIAGRGVAPASLPRTMDPRGGGEPLSDHSLIYVDVVLEA